MFERFGICKVHAVPFQAAKYADAGRAPCEIRVAYVYTRSGYRQPLACKLEPDAGSRAGAGTVLMILSHPARASDHTSGAQQRSVCL